MAAGPSDGRRLAAVPELGRATAMSVVAAALLALLVLQLWGLERELPYRPEVDESVVVLPASQIAASFDLNPRRFDYPGSTMIYPLALLHHVYEATARGGSWFAPNPSIAQAIATFDMRPYFLAGRLLSVAYLLGSVALVAWIGVRLFGRTTGALAAVLATACPLTVDIGQQARTDAAAAFYGAIFLLCCVRLLEWPSRGRSLAAGAALGLATATRYFMLATAPVLLAVEAALLRSAGRPSLGAPQETGTRARTAVPPWRRPRPARDRRRLRAQHALSSSWTSPAPGPPSGSRPTSSRATSDTTG